MHFCAIIIKPITMEIKEARTISGDYLIEKGISDWYSADEYRERTFDGKTILSLEDFKKEYEEWMNANDTWPFFILDPDEFIRTAIIPSTFFEFFEYEEREEMLKLYKSLYNKETQRILESLDTSLYDVVLLDYHN